METAPFPPTGRPSRAKLACRDCSLFQLCLPVGIDAAGLERLDRIIIRRRPLERGEYLFRIGDPFSAIFAVRSGSLKTYTLTPDGREQVTGFYLPGEIIALDAIGIGQHACAARTLETSSLCELPFAALEGLWGSVPELTSQILRVMSKEILHEQVLLMLLGKKTAEERLASLLLNLSQRFGQRGLSVTDFNLSMSRNDIGNYLGLAVETVSRLFSRLQEDGVLSVRGRLVRLHDLPRLRAMAGIPG